MRKHKHSGFQDAKITAQLNTFHYTVIDQIDGVKEQTAMESFLHDRRTLFEKIDGYISERQAQYLRWHPTLNLPLYPLKKEKVL
jgi:hypothetical protein